MNAGELVTRLESFLAAEWRRARRHLKNAGTNKSGAPVHEARKSIKKLRAALRLARNMAPRPAIDSVGVPLREAAHALGPLRDHLVLKKTGRELAKRGEPLPPEPEVPGRGPLLRRTRLGLSRAAGGLRVLLRTGFDESGAGTGLRRLYRRARKEMKASREKASDDNLHAWRRRAKDLGYALELLEAPADCVRKLARLTGLLGDDHDLASFARAHNSPGTRRTHHRLFKRAKKRRRVLQKKAFRLGRALFHRGGKEFVRRVLG
jgi:hypothetical protein